MRKNDAYLKQLPWTTPDKDGRSYTNTEKQFHWYPDDKVVEL